MNKKRIPVFLIITILAMCIMGGCSSKNNTVSGQKKEKKGGGKKFTISICGATLEDGINPSTKRPAEGWNTFKKNQLKSKFPDVNFVFNSIPWDNSSGKMQTLLMSKGTDLFTIGGAFIPEYYKEGLMQSLNPFIEADKDFVYEDNYPATFKTNMNCTDYSGKELLTLPWDVGYRLIIYDKQLFDDWGVEYLSENPTPEEIMEKAGKMTGTNPKSGKPNYGLWLEGNSLNMSYVIPLSQYFGAVECTGRFDHPADLKWSLNSDEFIATMQWIVDACQYVPDAATTGKGAEKFGKKDNDIAIAIDNNGVTIMNEYYNTKDESLLERYQPTMHVGTGGGNWTPIDGMGISSHLSGKDAKQAWEILKYMCGPETKEWDYKNYGPKAIGHLVSKELYDPKNKFLAKNSEVMAKATHPGYEINPFYGSNMQPTFASMISRAIAGKKVNVSKELNDLQGKAVQWSKSKK
jgi:hypothetical protein